ncbi:hypothetical protein [Methyloversatilis sp.]|uniref:hypothetical protein n=1 Tax=Methyloversatilis sp. TaxID=2569862 RepID=UPI0035B061BD
MSQWQRTLDLQESWTKLTNHEIPIHVFAQEVAEKLRSFTPFNETSETSREAYVNYMVDEVATEFENIAEEESDDVEWFDFAMGQLYNWADTSLDNQFGGKKNCWVRTAF